MHTGPHLFSAMPYPGYSCYTTVSLAPFSSGYYFKCHHDRKIFCGMSASGFFQHASQSCCL